MSKIKCTQLLYHKSSNPHLGFAIYGLGEDGQLYIWEFPKKEWVLA
jgi:hypothetical protein